MEAFRENTPVLTTERLILRPFLPADEPSIFSFLQDEEANRFLPWFPLKTLQETHDFLEEHFYQYYTMESAYRYALCLKENDCAVGYITLTNDESHDLGYGLKKEYWNQGLMTEGCSAVIRRLRESGFSYITATHDVNNPRSGAVMQKIGMTYRYSYRELTQPKNELVVFRMYQLNFTMPDDWVYRGYLEKSVDGREYSEI